MEQVRGQMARLPLFEGCAPGVLARLQAAAFLQAQPRGTVLFEQDEPAEFLHVLLSGRLALEARGEGTGGAATILELMAPGDVFLAAPVVLDRPNPTGGWVLTEARLLLLPAVEFRAAVAADGALARAALAMMARQYEQLADQLLDLKLRDAPRRVARFLAQRLSPAEMGGVVDLPEPRGALAARLGMRPESLSRALHGLQQAGLVRLKGRRVEVRDRAGLLDVPAG